MALGKLIYAKNGYKTKQLHFVTGSFRNEHDAIADGTDHIQLKCRKHNKILEILQVGYSDECDAIHRLVFHAQCLIV